MVRRWLISSDLSPRVCLPYGELTAFSTLGFSSERVPGKHHLQPPRVEESSGLRTRSLPEKAGGEERGRGRCQRAGLGSDWPLARRDELDSSLLLRTHSMGGGPRPARSQLGGSHGVRDGRGDLGT